MDSNTTPWIDEVYPQLKRLAAGFLARERRDHTLQATALVHEACVRLLSQERARFRSPTHLVALGATAMRRLLVDHARRHHSDKRGGGWQRVTLSTQVGEGLQDLRLEEILDLEQALERLETLDPAAARVIELRFFGGLGMQEIAEVEGRSKRSIERDWTHARAWLATELEALQRGG